MSFRDHFSVQRLRALESRYRATVRRLKDELKRPAPDFAIVQELKRKRLMIKDQIAELVTPSATRMPIQG